MRRHPLTPAPEAESNPPYHPLPPSAGPKRRYGVPPGPGGVPSAPEAPDARHLRRPPRLRP
eukprot:238585-Prorocentrum_minimum.AAC.1